MSMQKAVFLLFVFLTFKLAFCADMKLTSPVFKNNNFIPSEYSCEGQDINPPLTIEGLPQDTKSLALIVDDPDASMGTWVHWVVYNIEPVDKIEENTVPGAEAINNSGRFVYHGPCPPSGTHRYFFKVYALDTKIQDKVKDKADLEKLMKGHILASAELVGLYKRK